MNFCCHAAERQTDVAGGREVTAARHRRPTEPGRADLPVRRDIIGARQMQRPVQKTKGRHLVSGNFSYEVIPSDLITGARI